MGRVIGYALKTFSLVAGVAFFTVAMLTLSEAPELTLRALAAIVGSVLFTISVGVFLWADRFFPQRP